MGDFRDEVKSNMRVEEKSSTFRKILNAHSMSSSRICPQMALMTRSELDSNPPADCVPGRV